ncbi:hypothetical protein, partial [Hydrotalea sp.]|uniref:hypothetical protein n=1 Tax=Hydrotalea sp. TaxID=2881279 RepID=UPI003D153393
MKKIIKVFLAKIGYKIIKSNDFVLDHKTKYLRVGFDSNVENMNCVVRTLTQYEYPISVGSHSIINGNFIIENENGKIEIGSNTFIGGGMFISICGIEIGNDVMISWGCTVIDNDAHSLNSYERTNDVNDWKRGID